MSGVRTKQQILLYEWLGFGLIVLVLWLDEVLDLPHLLLGTPATPINTGEMIIETLLILPLAWLVTRATARLLQRVKHLEGLMHVCSSCQRVREGDEWIPLDEYLRKHTQAELAASLCRRCLLDQFASVKIAPPDEPSGSVRS